MAQVYFAPPASATPLDRQAHRDAWIDFLGRWEWEWFCTFTFRDMVHPEAADKRFRVLISQANRVLTYREQRSNTGRYPVQCAGQRSSKHVGSGVGLWWVGTKDLRERIALGACNGLPISVAHA
jgi:hypothetical protein